MVDLNRSTSGVVLPEEVSGEILAKVQEASIIQRAARRVTLPGAGVSFQTIVGEPIAEWVDETDEKPVSNSTISSKTMRGYTISVIEPFSNQFRRDKAGLYEALVDRLPGALAKKFDTSVFHGTAPGDNFDTLASVQAFDLSTGVYDAAVDAMKAIATAGYDMNGIILSPAAEALVYGEKDKQDRPLFIPNAADGSIGNILARPVFKSLHADNEPVVGFAGDWSQALWGAVGDVQIAVSDQASLTVNGQTINLFQRNMFAVRAEIEVGFLVSDEDAFVKFTNGAGS